MRDGYRIGMRKRNLTLPPASARPKLILRGRRSFAGLVASCTPVVMLARRALRFGAGQPAVDLLVSLDPAAATEFAPQPTSADAAPAPTGDAARGPDNPTKAESKPAGEARPEKRDAA